MMNKMEIENRIERLNNAINDAQRRLFHLIDCKRELQGMNTQNKQFQRQLENKYSVEAEALINTIRGLKAELGNLQDTLLVMELMAMERDSRQCYQH